MNVRIVKPATEWKEAYLDFYNDWKQAGEKIYPKVLESMYPERYEEMVQSLYDKEKLENVPEGYVPESVFLLVDERQRILGAVTIRHSLTEQLLKSEGHIGVGIRPSDRRRGYATKILELAIEKAREMDLEKVLITCNEDNIGSEKAILKNGGVADVDYYEGNGNSVKRYWITL